MIGETITPINEMYSGYLKNYDEKTGKLVKLEELKSEIM